jgi:hypothetical protein
MVFCDCFLPHSSSFTILNYPVISHMTMYNLCNWINKFSKLLLVISITDKNLLNK